MRDLVIAGGGPIGLAAALYAARAGLDVVVREPRTGVLDKACGEGLMPGAVSALEELGVPLEGHPITGIRYLDATRESEVAFRHGVGRGVRRTTLHAALAEAVRRAGVSTEDRQVGAVENRGDHVLVDGERVRHLIAADGLHSPVRRMVGLHGRASPLRRFGLRSHVDVAPWTSCVEVYWGRRAEVYVTPVGDDRVGVAVLTGSRRPYDEVLADFPRLLARLGGRVHSRVRGAGPLRQRTTSRVAGRVLLVGDAAGYVDALTGEGIALGLAQARAAVAAVALGRPERYEQDWHRLGRRHDLLTHALATSTRLPVVRRSLVPLASRAPWLFAAAVNQLARPAG